MRFTWDPIKAAANLATHGVSFEAIEEFEWVTALVLADVRNSYPEPRMKAIGKIGSRLHSVVFTVEPRQRAPRLISLWRANNKEARQYAAT